MFEIHVHIQLGAFRHGNLALCGETGTAGSCDITGISKIAGTVARGIQVVQLAVLQQIIAVTDGHQVFEQGAYTHEQYRLAVLAVRDDVLIEINGIADQQKRIRTSYIIVRVFHDG